MRGFSYGVSAKEFVAYDMQKPSTLDNLRKYLENLCYQPSGYHVGSGWSGCGDAYCIEKTGSGFDIFYVERGQRSDTIEFHQDEALACQGFLNILDEEDWSKGHCVAWSTSLIEINKFADLMGARGVRTRRNDIPNYSGAGDLRYRLFVFGRDKLAVDEMIRCGELPPLLPS